MKKLFWLFLCSSLPAAVHASKRPQGRVVIQEAHVIPKPDNNKQIVLQNTLFESNKGKLEGPSPAIRTIPIVPKNFSRRLSREGICFWNTHMDAAEAKRQEAERREDKFYVSEEKAKNQLLASAINKSSNAFNTDQPDPNLNLCLQRLSLADSAPVKEELPEIDSTSSGARAQSPQNFSSRISVLNSIPFNSKRACNPYMFWTERFISLDGKSRKILAPTELPYPNIGSFDLNSIRENIAYLKIRSAAIKSHLREIEESRSDYLNDIAVHKRNFEMHPFNNSNEYVKMNPDAVDTDKHYQTIDATCMRLRISYTTLSSSIAMMESRIEANKLAAEFRK